MAIFRKVKYADGTGEYPYKVKKVIGVGLY